ncbi:hypothetical protein KBD45_00890 [Candidatus Dojkabacteria bacterium]|nr:hypothetical protein [Candidatus Dojkabacteria bacterium]
MTAESVELFHYEFQNPELVVYGDSVFHVVSHALGGDLSRLSENYPYVDPTKCEPEMQRNLARLLLWATYESPQRHILLPPHFSTDHRIDFRNLVHNLLQEQPDISNVCFENEELNVVRLAPQVLLDHEGDDFIQRYDRAPAYDSVYRELALNYNLMLKLREESNRPDSDAFHTLLRQMRANLFNSPQEMEVYFAQIAANLSFTHCPTIETQVLDALFNTVPGTRHTAATIAGNSGITEDGKDGRTADSILTPSRGARCCEPPIESHMRVVGSTSGKQLLYALARHPFGGTVKRNAISLLPNPCRTEDGDCPYLKACPIVKTECGNLDMSALRHGVEKYLTLFLEGVTNYQAKNKVIIVVG